jgi:membrane-associated phospholipid phosphatase
LDLAGRARHDAPSRHRSITVREEATMRARLAAVGLLIIVRAAAAAPSPSTSATGGVEPAAGTWPTWVIGPAGALRRPPPPSGAAAEAEVAELRALAARRDAAALDVIRYWNTGPPSYRWHELAVAELLRRHAYSHVGARELALLHVAIHDGVVAAWDTKYAYRRPRPSAVDRGLTAAVAAPDNPSYPAEHAVAAGAASAVLASLHPERAAFYAERAEEAARSRLLAGVNYASDVRVGLALGREVAARVIEHRRADGSEVSWSGRVPTGPGKWKGTSPILPQAAAWKPWVLRWPGELRPPPPPAHDSPAMAAEMHEVRSVARTPKTDADAFFWEHAAGGARSYQFWSALMSTKLLEYRLDDNAPRAARAYALAQVAFHDAAVACWDAKYAYWAIRPTQLDPGFRPLFTTPRHPSYPSGHSCFSGAAAAVLSHLFPREAAAFEALASESSESRLWAGIHFRSDLVAGRALGRAVAERVIRRLAREDAR